MSLLLYHTKKNFLLLHEKKLPTITRKKTRIMEISHNPTNSICSQDHKQQTVTHTSYANFGTHPAWQWFILPRARATARRRRITATCQHASTDDTESHAWPITSCISLKGQALPLHTPILFPTSHNSNGPIQLAQFIAVRAFIRGRRAFQRDLHALHTYRCRPRRLRFGIKLRQWAQKCISAMPVRQRIDKHRSPVQLSHPHETFEMLMWDSVRKSLCVYENIVSLST